MIQRVDAREKVTGRAVYAADIALQGMLHARPLHAAHPHARIVEIDTAAARALPGVVAVLTAGDLPAARRAGGIRTDHYFLVEDKTRYQGDVLALVAAETSAAAQSGRDAIRVEYEPLPALTDAEEALGPDAPRVHPERGDNLIATHNLQYGDPEGARSSCARVFAREYRTQLVEHAYLEPEACVAVPEADGAVTVYGGMQHPFSTRRCVALATGLPLNRTRIVQTTLGGGFGGKDDTIAMVCARAAVLALHTGRPVRMVYSREESFRESYKRHPYRVRLELGVDERGRMRMLTADILADGGPYCTTSPFVIWRPTVQCTGPYRVPAVRCESRAVYTNNPLTGAMRGFGSPQYNFASETLIDEVAHDLGRDPVAFRRENFFTQGCTIQTGQCLDNHTVSIRAVMDLALERFGWQEKYERCSRGRLGADGNYYGVGLACCYRGVSLGAEGADFCASDVQVLPDGTILLQVGVSENGQGLKTAMVHILATELGVAPERIRFLDTDTSQIPDSGPTVASRGTLVGGNAVLDAVRRLRAIWAPILAERIGALEGEGYVYAGGFVRNPATGAKISFTDLVAACDAARIHLRAVGSWAGPHTSWDDARGQGAAYFTHVYSCNIAELQVAPDTGRVQVLRLLGAHDIGRAVNPQMAAGQIYGGLIMGMGFALGESYPVQDGLATVTNLDGYRLVRADEAPEVEALIIENPDPVGPWGAKSLGEPANEIAAPAITNAIFHATGVRIRALPVRPEAILEGLER